MSARRITGLLGLAAALALGVGCATGSPTPRASDQFGKCVIKAGTVCRNQDMSGLNLASADLRGADLSGSRLARADLNGADLSGANLTDADLSGTDFSRANLENANLTNAKMFYTIMTDANVTNTNFTGTKLCGVLLPSGALDDSGCVLVSTTTRVPYTSAPAIVSFATTQPTVCLNDASGTGVEISYEVQRATSIVVNLDDLKVLGSFDQKDTVRVPFVCDGKEHTLELEAVGPVAPSASQSITLSLRPGDPPKPPGAAVPTG